MLLLLALLLFVVIIYYFLLLWSMLLLFDDSICAPLVMQQTNECEAVKKKTKTKQNSNESYAKKNFRMITASSVHERSFVHLYYTDMTITAVSAAAAAAAIVVVVVGQSFTKNFQIRTLFCWWNLAISNWKCCQLVVKMVGWLAYNEIKFYKLTAQLRTDCYKLFTRKRQKKTQTHTLFLISEKYLQLNIWWTTKMKNEREHRELNRRIICMRVWK